MWEFNYGEWTEAYVFLRLLEIQEGYSKGLYKDVCKEYIAELNKELVQVKNSIKKELQYFSI